MATYCYTVPGGITVERDFAMGSAPPTIVLDDGVVAERDFGAEHSPRNAGGNAWPIECVASGVNANQADDLREYFREKGFRCEVSKDGNPIYENANHRRKALKLRGFVDKASFC